jgi:hypothetical protein
MLLQCCRTHILMLKVIFRVGGELWVRLIALVLHAQAMGRVEL